MPRTKYTKELLEPIVASSNNYYQVLRKLGKFTGGATWYLVKNKIHEFGIDTSHFVKKQSKGSKWGFGPKRMTVDEIASDGKTARVKTKLLRRAMIESGFEHSCSCCGTRSEWMGSALVLEIDHIDGNWRDCRLSNLRFLCPNCHSQTNTFGNKRRGGDNGITAV